MKKVKMLIAFIIVLAIVGSALSFRFKNQAFCVLNNNTSGTNCTTYLLGKQITIEDGTAYKYVPCFTYWDKITCTAAGNGLCTSTGTLKFITN